MIRIILICTLVLCLMLCSCGNMQLIGEYTYSHVYVETYKTDGHCYDVKKWTDSESGIEVLTEENGSMFLSEGTYILVSDKDRCPFCAEEKE